MKTLWLTEQMKKSTVALIEGKACIVTGIMQEEWEDQQEKLELTSKWHPSQASKGKYSSSNCVF